VMRDVTEFRNRNWCSDPEPSIGGWIPAGASVRNGSNKARTLGRSKPL
jgi:hypothetical protein